jgi:hypothetical protein
LRRDFHFNGYRGSSPNSAAFRFCACRRESRTPLSIIIGPKACLASLILALSYDYAEKILDENRLSVAALKKIFLAANKSYYNKFSAIRYDVKMRKMENIENLINLIWNIGLV